MCGGWSGLPSSKPDIKYKNALYYKVSYCCFTALPAQLIVIARRLVLAWCHTVTHAERTLCQSLCQDLFSLIVGTCKKVN